MDGLLVINKFTQQSRCTLSVIANRIYNATSPCSIELNKQPLISQCAFYKIRTLPSVTTLYLKWSLSWNLSMLMTVNVQGPIISSEYYCVKIPWKRWNILLHFSQIWIIMIKQEFGKILRKSTWTVSLTRDKNVVHCLQSELGIH